MFLLTLFAVWAKGRIMKNPTNLPQLLFTLNNSQIRPDFLHARNQGKWQTWSTQQAMEEVRYLQAALAELGLTKNTGLGILAPSCPQWMLMDLAGQLCGSWTVPMFPNIHPDHFCFQMQDSQVRVLLLASPGTVSPALLSHLNLATSIICLQDHQELPGALGYEDLIQRGKSLYDENEFNQRLNGLESHDIATIIYTSGSTGVPKGAELSHRNLLSQVESAREIFSLNPQDSALSALPIAHVFERVVTLTYMASGMSIHFADDPKNLGELLREVRPTILTVVPRLVERVYEKMQAARENAKGIRKILLSFALRAALSQPGILHPLWNKLVYSKLRANLGGRLRLLVSGSSALNPFLARFFLNLGVPIYEGYGLTECSPVLSACYPGHNMPGSVGPAFPGVELRISPTGEILAKTPGLMRGYHNNPQATAQCIDEDGWFHTGDLGWLDEQGYLRITGRCKDLFKTSTGKYVSPLPIELALSRHPLVECSLVVANNRKYVSALLFCNPETLRSYLKRNDRTFDINMAVKSQRVNRSIKRLLERVNAKLNPWEQVVRYTILTDIPTVESGLLTPTLKLRRCQVENYYSNQIAAMYAD